MVQSVFPEALPKWLVTVDVIMIMSQLDCSSSRAVSVHHEINLGIVMDELHCEKSTGSGLLRRHCFDLVRLNWTSCDEQFSGCGDDICFELPPSTHEAAFCDEPSAFSMRMTYLQQRRQTVMVRLLLLVLACLDISRRDLPVRSTNQRRCGDHRVEFCGFFQGRIGPAHVYSYFILSGCLPCQWPPSEK